MAIKRSDAYWDKRAISRLTRVEKHADAELERVLAIYDQAEARIQKDIATIYKNYSHATGVDPQKLRQLLTKGETDKFWASLEGKESKQYILDNYKSRITRLEQLQHQIHSKVKEIYPNEMAINTALHADTIKTARLSTAYDIDQGTGIAGQFAHLDTATLDTMLRERWQGSNYSERIWTNTDILAGKLSTDLTASILAGQSASKVSMELRRSFGVAKYMADRLVRTETAYFENAAEATIYEDMGIDKYVFVATLDSRTSETCQEHDGKVYELRKKAVGENYPPLHPNCRSTVRPYIGKDYEPTSRRVRSTNRKTADDAPSQVLPSMTYQQWENAIKPADLTIRPTIQAPTLRPTGLPEINLSRTPEADPKLIAALKEASLDVQKTYPAAYQQVKEIKINPEVNYNERGAFRWEYKTAIDSDLPMVNGHRNYILEGGARININLLKPTESLASVNKLAVASTTASNSAKDLLYHESAHGLEYAMTLARTGLTQTEATLSRAVGKVINYDDIPTIRAVGQLRKININENDIFAATIKQAGAPTEAAAKKAWITKNISEYANDSESEGFAELFTKVMRGDTDPTTKVFKKHLDAELGRLGITSKASAAVKQLKPEPKVVLSSKTSTGEVVRVGDVVQKNTHKTTGAKTLEGEIYEKLSGKDGIAKGRIIEKGQKIELPYYNKIISIDTTPKQDRWRATQVVENNFDRINKAVSELTNAGYKYNDPLQFGYNGGKLDLMDFSNAMKVKTDDAIESNLAELSRFYSDFGADGCAGIIDEAQTISSAYKDTKGVEMFGDAGIYDKYPDLLRKEFVEPKNIYYCKNSREIVMRGIVQTNNDKRTGIKFIFSEKPLTGRQLDEWEIIPIISKPLDKLGLL